MNYRLTVHLEGQPHIQKATGKKVMSKATKKMVDETKTVCFNTLSFYCKTKDACIQKLAEVRSKYTIAKGTDYKKKDKFDKELFNISWVN